jgi:phosphoribosylamine--glycine ligase
MLWAAATNNLNNVDLKISQQTAVTVVMVSGGYPDAYQKNMEIRGLSAPTQSIIFHAGTTRQNNQIVTNGGRVLAITSLAPTIELASEISYKTINNLQFENQYFRTDIGKDLL